MNNIETNPSEKPKVIVSPRIPSIHASTIPRLRVTGAPSSPATTKVRLSWYCTVRSFIAANILGSNNFTSNEETMRFVNG